MCFHLPPFCSKLACVIALSQRICLNGPNIAGNVYTKRFLQPMITNKHVFEFYITKNVNEVFYKFKDFYRNNKKSLIMKSNLDTKM